ncbi:MAG TPA: hypothetical protein PKD68_03245, partial [Candidatus Saccharibacteria bacterium]|nr:hypothetical protein [Candidatus Saccharibacteria bacterium]
MEVIRDKIVAMLRFLWRFKYIVLVLILLVVSAGAWVIYQNQLNAKWSHAIDSYRRANYDEAAGHLKGLSIPDDPERLQ